jgi:hypothetical protein
MAHWVSGEDPAKHSPLLGVNRERVMGRCQPQISSKVDPVQTKMI